jgi:hypothetical protein
MVLLLDPAHEESALHMVFDETWQGLRAHGTGRGHHCGTGTQSADLVRNRASVAFNTNKLLEDTSAQATFHDWGERWLEHILAGGDRLISPKSATRAIAELVVRTVRSPRVARTMVWNFIREAGASAAKMRAMPPPAAARARKHLPGQLQNPAPKGPAKDSRVGAYQADEADQVQEAGHFAASIAGPSHASRS